MSSRSQSERASEARRLLLEHGWPEQTVDIVVPVALDLNAKDPRATMEMTVIAIMTRAHQYVNRRLQEK